MRREGPIPVKSIARRIYGTSTAWKAIIPSRSLTIRGWGLIGVNETGGLPYPSFSPREKVPEGRMRVFRMGKNARTLIGVKCPDPHPPLRGTFSRGEKGNEGSRTKRPRGDAAEAGKYELVGHLRNVMQSKARRSLGSHRDEDATKSRTH